MGGTADGYRVPAATAEGELREKGSRFLAIVGPAASEEAAEAVLAAIRARHPDATHYCWGWRLGREGRQRSSDDGEPAGTAGVPILQVLRGADLADALVVVVRWFGGTKLGKGGLARAYAAAASTAVDRLPVARKVPTFRLVVEPSYERLGAVKRLVHPPEVELVDERYERGPRLTMKVFGPRLESVSEALRELGLTGRVEPL